MDGDKQPVHMEDRQCVDEHIVRAPTPVLLEHPRVAQQIAVREHGALAAARGAAGVQDGSQVIRLARHGLVFVAMVRSALQQAARAVIAERENVLRPRSKGDLRHPAKVARGAHHHGRFGVADEVFDLGALVGGVERQKDVACAQCGQVQQHGLDRLFHLHGDAAALGQLQRRQQVGNARAGLVQVAPGVVQRRAVGAGSFDGRLAQVRRECGAQGAEQVARLHAHHSKRSKNRGSLGQEGADALAVLGAVGIGVGVGGAIHYAFDSCLRFP